MKSKAIIPVTKISLGKKPNPRFNLDEDNLPPEYTPVVLLNEDFGQDIELSDSPGKDTTTPVKTIVEQTSSTKDLPRYNAPIEGYCRVHHHPSCQTRPLVCHHRD